MDKVISLEKERKHRLDQKLQKFFDSIYNSHSITKGSTEWRTRHFLEVIGHYFRVRRKEKKISLEVLSILFNLDKVSLLAFEQGYNSLSFSDIKELFSIIGVEDQEFQIFLSRLNEYFSGNSQSLDCLNELFKA